MTDALALGRVRAAVAELCSTLPEIEAWVSSPIPYFDGKTATELVAEGRESEVLDLIAALVDGVYL